MKRGCERCSQRRDAVNDAKFTATRMQFRHVGNVELVGSRRRRRYTLTSAQPATPSWQRAEGTCLYNSQRLRSLKKKN